mmetsp:Transcript_8615/g.15635  ORF Transcript_8615/g.15635 Transcript_8615/m.15635 type:complete len:437 (-) Transcript_8615:662-1972(-)
MPRDGLVQLRLGKHGLIHLIVSKTAVANHINHHIRAPFVPPLDGSFKRSGDGDGIITIDMEDRTVERLSKIRRIWSGAAVDWIGSVTNLVIDNDVKCPTDVKVIHTGHLHCFVNHSLSGKGCISVEEDGHDVADILFGVTTVELLCAGLTKHDRVDAFKMGRVGHEAEVDLSAIRVGTVHARSKMVLHIPSTPPIIQLLSMILHIIMSVLKLAKNSLHRLSHHIRQYIQPPPVWHANNKTMRSQLRRTINSLLQRRNDGLPPIQSKSFRGIEFIHHKALKHISEAETFKDVNLLFLIAMEKGGVFHTFSDPIALLRRSNVHVFHANGVAVRFAETIDHLAQRDLAGHVCQIFQESLITSGMHALQVQISIHVLLGIKAMKAHGQGVGVSVGSEVRRGTGISRTVGESIVRVHAEGIDVGRPVAIDLIGADEMCYSQ